MREALNGRPESERTRKDYQKVADAYRKVYYVSPASSKADASVMAVAEILAEMGRQFAPDEKDLQAAIGQYKFLRREYPGSKFRVEALFTIGQIYSQDLNDEAAAKATFEEFLKKYPHNALSPKAQDALAELNQPKTKKKPEVVAKNDVAPDVQQASSAVKKTAAPRVTGIRYWSTADYTRVAIDLDGEVKYEAGRVPDPDRIFFDLPDTRLVSTLVGKSFDVHDGFLKKIRVAQYQKGSTRVVLDVDDVTEYSAFLLPNPYRLIIDIHGKNAAATQAAAKQPADLKKDETTSIGPANSSASGAAVKPNGTGSVAANVSSAPETPVKLQPKTAGGTAKTQVSPKTEANSAAPPAQKEPATTTMAFKSASGNLAPETKAVSKPPTALASLTKKPDKGDAEPIDDTLAKTTIKPAARATNPPDKAEADSVDNALARAMTKPTTAPTAVTVGHDKQSSASKKAAKNTAAEIPPVHAAVPTSEGDRSLIRALGLKIGRIVIDAGHGGHDTGTIGPDGLLEKDLVLDVALRLGKLLESRLGAEVIYTRDDDTFIPLETRTAVANEKQADLFISVHANSSQDPSARGVETYYLNFTSNADALEVAARENAVSEKSIHELQDLVKKITLKEKIEESRELAGDVQQSLYTGLSPKNPTLRNRGVKKAPFVVLIGANMPSILAEISFVSNPTDEKKLETPEYRQKIAESLCKGISKYVSGLSGVKVASKFDKAAGK